MKLIPCVGPCRGRIVCPSVVVIAFAALLGSRAAIAAGDGASPAPFETELEAQPPPATGKAGPTTRPTTAPATAPATAPTPPTIVSAVKARDFARAPKRVLEAIYPPPKSLATQPATPATAPASTAPSTQPADPFAVKAAEFERDVLAGDWEAVGAFLASLKQEEAEPIYLHVLSSLSGSGGRPGADGADPRLAAQEQARLQQMRNMGIDDGTGGGGSPAGAPTAALILPDDVLKLGDAYPSDPTPAHVAGLGKLLATSLKVADASSMVVNQLEQGRRHFGGIDPAKRRRAATLLLAANLDALALKFLPPVDASTEDRSLLEDRIRALSAEGDQKQKRGGAQEDREAAELRRIYEMYGYSASLVPAATQVTKQYVPQHSEALMLSARLLALPAPDAAARASAIDRAMGLLPKVEQSVAEEFLRRVFAGRPDDVGAVVALVGASTSQRVGGGDVAQRAAALGLQRRIADRLVSQGEKVGQGASLALDVLAMTWLAEERLTESQPAAKEIARSGGRRLIRLPNGEMTYVSGNQFRGQQRPTVPEADLLASGPHQDGGRWLDTVDPSLRAAVIKGVATLLIRDEQVLLAMDWIERLAPLEPAAATDLSAQLLRTWARVANPNPSGADQEQMRMAAMQGYSVPQQANGIALTRVRQDRNVRELAAMLARIRKLPGGAPPIQVISEAFVTAHSDAEVFRPDNVQAVFGPVADIDPESLASLLGTMRQRLAQQWRQPQIQQQAGTKRDDKAIAAEVDRGYRLIIEAADASIAKQGRKWPIELAAASATFDWNEFKYGRGLPLAEYTQRRDAAFARFAAASATYVSDVKSAAVPLPSETVNPFMGWFLAALGASDLAQLTRQQTPQLSQVALVQNAIAALPAEAAGRHADAFATALGDQSKTINPELKYRYLSAGLTVVGDNPKAVAAADLVRYYRELLGELEFVARLDGSSTSVGTQPFGVHFGVRHTAALGRESGGFGRYLVQPNANAGYYYPQQPNLPKTDRDRLEKNLREALSDSFDILSITWHAADVEPRGDPARQSGWRYTPLAFLLLKAKDRSADRVPAARMDFDFRDSTGRVVLPVESSVIAVDARNKPAAGATILADVSVIETLDESESAKGQLTLEVRATGTGLLPELDELLDLTPLAPWTLKKTGDGVLTVNGLDLKGEEVRPLSGRSWILMLQRPPDDGRPFAEFRYPPPLQAIALATGGIKYQRYAGSDLVSVGPAIELRGFASTRPPWWKIPLIVLCVVALVLLAVLKLYQKARRTIEPARKFRVPENLTPFTLVALLRRLEQDPSGAPAAGNGLSSEIKRLEQLYFSEAAAAAAADPAELHRVARKWVSGS